MYPKEQEDDSDYKQNDWENEYDPSTGSYHRVKHNNDGTSTYDFGMGGGKVKYDKYGNEI